jgi:plastocyanin
MRRGESGPILGAALLVAAALVAAPGARALAAPPPPSPSWDARAWLGEELPLPLAVRTPQDLAVKSAAEKQYLIFNLLSGGKLAWDSGDFATAATKWEALLRIHPIDPDLEKTIKPLAHEARSRAGEQPASAAVDSSQAQSPSPTSAGTASGVLGPPALPVNPNVTVSGTVSGGGALGPGGAVIWLKRANGETPRPTPAHGKTITQRNKTFAPRVLVVPVGSKVAFRNDDAIFHNIFSLTKPNEFDTGLYKQGETYTQTFRHPGAVQLLCNIHASMLGFVIVVDTPYYAQAEASGVFSMKGVPPGEYEVSVWHEASLKPTIERLTVGANGAHGLTLRVGGDKRAPQFLPDKSGKPRQSHLGY